MIRALRLFAIGLLGFAMAACATTGQIDCGKVAKGRIIAANALAGLRLAVTAADTACSVSANPDGDLCKAAKITHQVNDVAIALNEAIVMNADAVCPAGAAALPTMTGRATL